MAAVGGGGGGDGEGRGLLSRIAHFKYYPAQ